MRHNLEADFGRFLRSNSLVSETQLHFARLRQQELQAHEGTWRPLASILLELGILDRSAFRRALSTLLVIPDDAFELQDWGQGTLTGSGVRTEGIASQKVLRTILVSATRVRASLVNFRPSTGGYEIGFLVSTVYHSVDHLSVDLFDEMLNLIRLNVEGQQSSTPFLHGFIFLQLGKIQIDAAVFVFETGNGNELVLELNYLSSDDALQSASESKR